MVLQKPGTVFCADEKKFVVGGTVFANDESEYAGLFGTVLEIRTGDDRETENDTPDIYCEFLPPESDGIIHELEERFSELYQQPKKIGEFALDYVIMAPEMLIPIPDMVSEEVARTYTVTCYFHTKDGCIATTVGISEDIGVLIRIMLADAKKHSSEVVLLSATQENDVMYFEFGITEPGHEFYAEYRIARSPVYIGGGNE